MERYLVIETKIDEEYFMHFIDLKSEDFAKEIEHFYHHLRVFETQKVIKVYFSDTALTNW